MSARPIGDGFVYHRSETHANATTFRRRMSRYAKELAELAKAAEEQRAREAANERKNVSQLRKAK